MEHRWGERMTVDILVRLASRPYAVRTGRMTDLSMSGAHIEIAENLRVFTRVQVAIILPSHFSRTTPVFSAYVARHHRHGVGVEWCDSSPKAVIELLRSPALHTRHRVSRERPHGGGQPSPPGLMHGT